MYLIKIRIDEAMKMPPIRIRNTPIPRAVLIISVSAFISADAFPTKPAISSVMPLRANFEVVAANA